MCTVELYILVFKRSHIDLYYLNHTRNGNGNRLRLRLMHGLLKVITNNTTFVIPILMGCAAMNSASSRGGPDRYSQKKGPRRTDFRVNLSGLAEGTSWQDLKRSASVSIRYSTR